MRRSSDVDVELPAAVLEREAVEVAARALAGLLEGRGGPDAALLVASANAGDRTTVRFWTDALAQGVNLASPELFPWCLANAPCGALARRFAITGPNCTWLGGEEAVEAAFAAARDALEHRRVARAFVVSLRFGTGAGPGRLQAWQLERTPAAASGGGAR